MDEQIRQIGERIRGLRDALDLSVEDMAGQCGLTMWIAGRAVSAD